MAIVNLEPLCARYGMAIIDGGGNIKDKENTITKALGVLVENGLYAMALFLVTCKEKEFGRKVLTERLRSLWQEEGVNIIKKEVKANQDAMLKAIQSITEDLHKLILAKNITEQTLTFARYHAKAKSKEEKKAGGGKGGEARE